MNTSYQRTAKSSILIGGTQVINIILGIVRTKVLAILLGPAGLGVADLYRSATSTIGSIAGCGLGNSGVRQIAEAFGSGNREAIARTVTALRRISYYTGLAGLFAVLALSRPLSKATFGDTRHATGLALMSLTVLLGNIGAAQYALLQGMRRIRDLAKCQILGAVVGTVTSIGIIYWLRQNGIALYLIVVAAASVCGSWYYARKIELPALRMRWTEVRLEIRVMLGLGVAFLLSGLTSSAANYFTRLLIVRKLGLDAVGLYQATWTLSGLYVGFVLTAMATDFYPRLTGVAQDRAACNRLINEQTEVGLLMALPGVLGTLVLAPWLLGLFYSKSFLAAGEIVRWHIMGVPLQVATYPLGFLQVAQGRGQLYLVKEVVVAAVYLLFIYAAIKLFGLPGIGYYYFFARLFHLMTEYFIARRLTGFRWSAQNFKALVGAGVGTLITLLVVTQFRTSYGIAIGLGITATTAIVCLVTLDRLLGRAFWIQLWHSLRPPKT